jgi:hypothetical protein
MGGVRKSSAVLASRRPRPNPATDRATILFGAPTSSTAPATIA